jgi:hydrogenase maturation protease
VKPVDEEGVRVGPPKASVAVLGLGNVLMGDDALGPTVIKVLEAEYEFSPRVSVEELGTPGLDLTPYLAGVDALIVVDTVRASGAVGEVRLYRREQILEHRLQPRLSPHDPSLEGALLAIEFSGGGPRQVLLVGVIPGEVRTKLGLSPAVRAAVPQAVAKVVEELDRLGFPPHARLTPAAPELWWERT